MKFQKGQTVQLTEKARKEWKESGALDGPGWVFNGTHIVDSYSGSTLYTTEHLGIHNADEVLELAPYQEKQDENSSEPLRMGWCCPRCFTVWNCQTAKPCPGCSEDSV